MFYWLSELAGELSIFNIFRYITFRTGGALIDHAGSQCSPRSALLRFLETKRGASAWCVGASAGTLSLLRYQQTSLRRTKLHSLKLLYANQSGLQCIVPTTCLFSAPTSRAKACCASPREDAFIGIP